MFQDGSAGLAKESVSKECLLVCHFVTIENTFDRVSPSHHNITKNTSSIKNVFKQYRATLLHQRQSPHSLKQSLPRQHSPAPRTALSLAAKSASHTVRLILPATRHNPPLIIPTVSRPPLTLFPKCFSSFPHGTCSLSVSCPYLALDDAYHPF